MGAMYRRSYRITRAAGTSGLRVVLPPELETQHILRPGQAVDLIYSYDGFVLIVSQGVRVDEEFLRRAVLQEMTP
jgi:hypothetical protein